MYGRIRQWIGSGLPKNPFSGKPTVLHTGHLNTAACDYSNRSADLGTY